MTIGEKMVWAAVFASETKGLHKDSNVALHQIRIAARIACHRVQMLQEAVTGSTLLSNEPGQMAREMLS